MQWLGNYINRYLYKPWILLTIMLFKKKKTIKKCAKYAKKVQMNPEPERNLLTFKLTLALVWKGFDSDFKTNPQQILAKGVFFFPAYLI